MHERKLRSSAGFARRHNKSRRLSAQQSSLVYLQSDCVHSQLILYCLIFNPLLKMCASGEKQYYNSQFKPCAWIITSFNNALQGLEKSVTSTMFHPHLVAKWLLTTSALFGGLFLWLLEHSEEISLMLAFKVKLVLLLLRPTHFKTFTLKANVLHSQFVPYS